MPTYTYECKKCSYAQDVFHAMSATPVVKCDKCGGATKRLMGTGAGLIFKGTGFYETDYKKNGSGAKNGSAATSESKASSTSESKSEAATDAKGTAPSSPKSGGDKAA